MAWLGTWQNRIKIEIDYTKIDSDLSDFPTLIPISANAGKDDQDISAIFDELTSDANRKKIAITTSNGTTQCYVEIERWDDANEKAELWVKAPSISSASNTVLYLYYDSDQADNTTYVGDVTDAAAQTVWDSDFELVLHMAQDPEGNPAGCMKDSTSNVHHMDPASMASDDLVESKVGLGIVFNGINNRLIEPNIPALNSTDLTLEFEFNWANGASNKTLLHHGRNNSSGNQGFHVNVLTDDTIYVHWFNGGWYSEVSTTTCSTGYNSTAIVYDKTAPDMTFYFSGVPDAVDPMAIAFPSTGAELRVGCRYNVSQDQWWDNDISEVRISTIQRSAAWIKATHHSNWDNLISFGSVENFAPFQDLNTEISGGSESIQDLTTDIQVNAESFFDLQTEISATIVQTILDLDTEIAADFNISFEDLSTEIQVVAKSLIDLDTDIQANTQPETIIDLDTDIQAASGDVFYDLNTDIQAKDYQFYDLNTEISVIRSKYWLDTEIEALSYARWSFNTEWNPNRFLNTEIAAKKPYTFSFKTKTGSSYVASSSEIEILLSGYSWPLRTLFLDFLRIGTSNVYNFDIWFARGHSGKNPLRNAKIKAEYTNTQFANGYEVISCDWLSLKVGDGAYQTVNETPLLLGDMPCDSKLSVSLKVECRDCSLTRGLVYFKLVFSGDYTESVYNSIGYGDGAQYFSGDCDDYQSPSFICRLYVV